MKSKPDGLGRQSQPLLWDRGRPARNAPQARSFICIAKTLVNPFFALRAHCGRDARGPREEVDHCLGRRDVHHRTQAHRRAFTVCAHTHSRIACWAHV